MRAIRWIVGSLLIVLAGLGSAGSVVALFVHTQVNDTDSYVDTVAPLASDPAVQTAVVDRLTEELTQRLDGFPQVVTRQAERLVHEAAQSLVSSDQFATLWTAANRQAHAQLAAMVTGRATDGIVRSDDSGTLSTEQRALSLVGLATAVAMIALLMALAVVRRVYLQNSDIPSSEAAVAVYDALAVSLVSSIRVLLACGVAVAVVGYVAGGSRSATLMRARISQLIPRGSEANSSTHREVPGPPR